MTRGRNPRRETRSPGDEGRGPLENERENLQLSWGGWGRTSNLPVNSRALCRLSYTPRNGGS